MSDDQFASDGAAPISQAAALSRATALATLSAPGSEHEIVTTDIRGQRLRVFKNAPSCLGALFAQTRSDATSLVYEEEQLSFAETHDLAAKLAQALVADYGITKGDRVAISMRNYPEWVVSLSLIHI